MRKRYHHQRPKMRGGNYWLRKPRRVRADATSSGYLVLARVCVACPRGQYEQKPRNLPRLRTQTISAGCMCALFLISGAVRGEQSLDERARQANQSSIQGEKRCD